MQAQPVEPDCTGAGAVTGSLPQPRWGFQREGEEEGCLLRRAASHWPTQPSIPLWKSKTSLAGSWAFSSPVEKSAGLGSRSVPRHPLATVTLALASEPCTKKAMALDLDHGWDGSSVSSLSSPHKPLQTRDTHCTPALGSLERGLVLQNWNAAISVRRVGPGHS